MAVLSLHEIFEQFNSVKVLIIGDVMIDSYIYGKVERISPEAPVPIVTVKNKEKRLGGAANVALNIQALGATPILCSVVGEDRDGEILKNLLHTQKITAEGIISSNYRTTTKKQRIMSGSHHLLRIDSEMSSPINPQEEEQLIRLVSKKINEADVVIFEDYDKGTITPKVIEQVIALAKKKGIPTVVDPKKNNFLFYEGATLFKPNLKELKEGLKIDFDAKNLQELQNAVTALKSRLSLKNAFITLSERGIYIDCENEKHLLPAHIRSISDVSGAGDTVISIAALGMALNAPPKFVAALSNLGGGLVCEHIGVVPIDKSSLYQEALHHKLLDEHILL